MPPASLSTLAVISPGPITARKTSSCAIKRRPLRGAATGAMASSASTQYLRKDVVHRDDAEQLSFWCDHRHREQAVLGGDLRHLVNAGIDEDRPGRLPHQVPERRGR